MEFGFSIFRSMLSFYAKHHLITEGNPVLVSPNTPIFCCTFEQKMKDSHNYGVEDFVRIMTISILWGRCELEQIDVLCKNRYCEKVIHNLMLNIFDTHSPDTLLNFFEHRQKMFDHVLKFPN